ncbi:hypothetical protein SDC9_142117 [bioreactor metagenome]|uniref:Uncharacterized protein n=1 Tax=bioreactor metagenome TaxID=1076179 RepID=A0A645E0S6_9ZZZZ
MLTEVLLRLGQHFGDRPGGEGVLHLPVAGLAHGPPLRAHRPTPDGAGEHPRGDQPLVDPDQHLGGRADHVVDPEGPAAWISRPEPPDQPPRVDPALGGGDDIPGQHDLLQPSTGDPADGGADRRLPIRAGHRSVRPGHRPGTDRGGGPGRQRRLRQRLIDRADPGHPVLAVAAAEHQRRHHQHRTAGRVVVVEGEGSEGQRPDPRGQVVRPRAGGHRGHHRPPPGVGLGQRVDLASGGLAEPDHPVVEHRPVARPRCPACGPAACPRCPAMEPGARPSVGEEILQRTRIVERGGDRMQAGDGRERGGLHHPGTLARRHHPPRCFRTTRRRGSAGPSSRESQMNNTTEVLRKSLAQ